MSYHYDSSKPTRWHTNVSDMHQSKMKSILIKLGLLPDPTILTAQHMEDASRYCLNNFGKSDTMLVNKDTYEALKKLNK